MKHEQTTVSQVVIIRFQIEFVFIRFDSEQECVQGFLLYHGNCPEVSHQCLKIGTQFTYWLAIKAGKKKTTINFSGIVPLPVVLY